MRNRTGKSTDDPPSRRIIWQQFGNEEILSIFMRVVPAEIVDSYDGKITREEAIKLIESSMETAKKKQGE